MTVIQHQAILLDHSLATARPNPNKRERIEHYANIAFPPAAEQDLIAMITAAANGVALGNLYLPVTRNADRVNQKGVSTTFAGVPGNWFILRVSATPEYPPACVDMNGAVLTTPAQINAAFYSGRRIMADVWFKLSAPHQKGQSIFANLAGVVAQEDGERLAIGRDTIGALQQFAKASTPSGPAPSTHAAQVAQPQNSPFSGTTQTPAQTATQAQAAAENPFVQRPAAGGSPFVQ